MKVLITGATGLVGTKLTAALRAQKISVHYLSTQKGKLQSLPDYKGFYWNPNEGVIDTNCFQGIDALIHLAGASIAQPWTKKNKKEIVASRVVSSQLLLETMQKQHIQLKTIVAASAIGIYPSSFSKTYQEDTAIALQEDDFLQTTVAVWEKATQAMRAVSNHLAQIRIGLVLSPKGGVLPQLMLPVKMGIGSPTGSGAQWQSWIHIDDLVAVFIQAVMEQWEGIFNATAPNPCTQKELVQELGKQLKRPIWMPAVPAFALKLLMGERSALALSSQKVLPVQLKAKNFSFKYPTLENALSQILKP